MSCRSVALLLLGLCQGTFAQTNGTLQGRVLDPQGAPIEGASIAAEDLLNQAVTASDGRFKLVLPAGRTLLLRVAYAAYSDTSIAVQLAPGEVRDLAVRMSYRNLGAAEVSSQREAGVQRIDPRVARFVPSVYQGVEALLQGQIGVVMRNELSSAYSVRGGNYDENLVYVNDIEVYRPFLVRAGQQEGLSFPNPDMIERIAFSAGGFEARYGDKMSSVLDITYKRPKAFGGSAMASLLGGAISVESAMLQKRLHQVTGFRYRTNQYVLQGLDTRGEYDPRYMDLQTYWTYDLTDRIELGFLGMMSENRFNLVPQDRQTDFGNFNEALRFTVFFDGEERTRFQTWQGALNANVKAGKNVLLKFTASAFRTYEDERFTILGEYRFSELDRDPSDGETGEVVRDLGVGGYLDHARNSLRATVLGVGHKGVWQHRGGTLRWGADVRTEKVIDELNEWTLLDSAGYSIPQGSDTSIDLQYALKADLAISSLRSQAYVQQAWEWKTGPHQNLALTVGARAHHWNYNGQLVGGPRMRLVWTPGLIKRGETPSDTAARSDWRFWSAMGFYYQPPFYRELRGLDGTLNPELQAQRSIHFLVGGDRTITMWDRPFRWTTETYYKALDNIVPYEVDNVRLRYYANNNASGFAVGVDTKLNGELVKGIESWVSLSVMSVQEDIADDSYVLSYNSDGERIFPGFTLNDSVVSSRTVKPGNIPRPTDQRVGFSMFFQDEMKRWPTYKVHLNVVFGTGLPFGPPNNDRYSDTLRTELYRRVDIGFSKQLLGAPGQERTDFLAGVENMWLSLEVFNLLNLKNTIDYTWISDIRGRQYAIPDLLTPRRVNAKLIVWF
jgi:Carboxypeptidase regulatory-like domain/TonB-dependent Receptor Plug Domain